MLAYARETVRDPEGGQLRQRVRYWSALALLRALASSPRAAAATLRTRAANLDAAGRGRGRPARPLRGLDLPDEETIESADATPGADADAGGGRHPAPAAAEAVRRAAPAALEGAGDTQARAARADGGQGTAARRLQPGGLLPVHRHRRVRRRAPERNARRRLRGRRGHRHAAARRADAPDQGADRRTRPGARSWSRPTACPRA